MDLPISINQCPDCQRLLSFTSQETNMIVCPSCGSTITRTALGRLIVKPAYVIAAKNDILQPGSTGVFEGKNFTVLGRFRTWYEESVYNYWTIQYDDGKIEWLGEGYGEYCILRKKIPSIEVNLPEITKLPVGNKKTLSKDTSYFLFERLNSSKWEIEGELYMPESQADFKEFVFANTAGSKLILFSFKDKETHSYDVLFTKFADLQLKNLRDTFPSSRIFDCTKCGNDIQVKAYPYSQSFSCSNCGMFYSIRDLSGLDKEIQGKADDSYYIPVGSKGVLYGIAYEVIGYSQREEQNIYKSRWQEYTIYNPQEGFATLSEYNGHWIYIRERQDSPVMANTNHKEFTLDGEPFILFNSYTYAVVNARGEFPYNIFNNGETRVKEFISPPEVWIEERNNREGITWFHGNHISDEEIQHAFTASSMPRKSGIGAVQPTGFLNTTRLVRAFCIAAAVLLTIHLIISFTKTERLLFSEDYQLNDSTVSGSYVTPKFTLEKSSSNLVFDIIAPVSNSWFELSGTLVNAETGKEYNFEQGVEYYFGFTEGENWTEGSQQEALYLSRIPAGNYFLQFDGLGEAGQFTKINSFHLSVFYDMPVHLNLFWSLGLLLLWPVWKYIFRGFNERRRWENSPFSKYDS